MIPGRFFPTRSRSLAMRRSRPFLALLLAGAAAAGCGRGEQADATREPVMDTTNTDTLDGVPSQVLVESAEAISPEVAAQRGLIRDTVTPGSTGDPGRDSVPGAPASDAVPPGMPPESSGIRIPRP